MGDLMMGATRATYHEAYLEKMAQLKEINEAAHKYLVDIGEQHWSKHAFKTYAKCDVLMNDLSEPFNVILLTREKPIVTMLEWIRTYCMTRFATMKQTAHKVEGKIMPKPRKRLDREDQHNGSKFASFSTDNICEVTHSLFIVRFFLEGKLYNILLR